MASKSAKQTLNVNDIVSPEAVIHPALDWVENQLIVGVCLNGGDRGVLSSKAGLLALDAVEGKVCDLGAEFESPVEQGTARTFLAYLENPDVSASAKEVAELLGCLASHIRRFVVFPDPWWPELLATWILGTYLFPVFQTFPYVRITSPGPGCGKSLLGQLLAQLAFNGEFLTSPNEANIFRLSETNRGALVWDEVELSTESERKRFEANKAVILNGYRNGGAVPRQVGKQYDKTVRFHVYCPRVFIGLSPLPEAAVQRTIGLNLKKRTETEPVEQYRSHDQTKAETEVRQRCLLAALKSAERVEQAYKNERLRHAVEEIVSEVGRTADDIWFPLFAVAAATRDSDDIDLGSPLFELLSEAAKALAHRQRESPGPSEIRARPSELPNAHDACRNNQENLALHTALDILTMVGPVTPTELATRVNLALNFEVGVQRLSKRLNQLGIRSSKVKGKRVVEPAPEEVASARTKLAPLCMPEQEPTGQHGQDGQQHEGM